MVFSLFGKRDNKSTDQKTSNESKKPAKSPVQEHKNHTGNAAKVRTDAAIASSRSVSSASSVPANIPRTTPATSSAHLRRVRPNINPEIQRELARATAAKIDAIESEMALDFGGGVPPPPAKLPNPPLKLSQTGSKATQKSPTNQPAALSLPEKGQNAARLENSSTLPPLDATTSIILGDETGAFAFEIDASQTSPIIEEVAILYANGQETAAAAALAGAIKQDELGNATMEAWLMLFDLYHIMNKREDFESLAIDFVSKFEASPPVWRDNDTESVTSQTQSNTSNPNSQVVVIATLNDNLAGQIQQFEKLAQRQPEVIIDFSKLSGVTAEGARVFLNFIRKIERAKKPEVGLFGLNHLLKTLQANVETGRQDPTEDVWMLLLETYRLLNLQTDFEEASINYCITYEVSPPAWEAPPKHLKTTEVHLSDGQLEKETPVISTSSAADKFQLTNELEGNAEVELSSLMTYAENHAQVEIYCDRLRRVDFTAAGALLNALVSLQASGRRIEFVNLNHLVAALFVVMGIHQFAALHLRKI